LNFEIGAQERRAKCSDEFLGDIAFIAPPLEAEDGVALQGGDDGFRILAGKMLLWPSTFLVTSPRSSCCLQPFVMK